MLLITRLLSVLFFLALIFSFSPVHSKSLKFRSVNANPVVLSYNDYEELSDANKKLYIKAIRTAFLKFEKKIAKKGKKKKYYGGLPVLLLPLAEAEFSTEKWCVVGGRARRKRSGKCPTVDYNCELEGSTDNYKCGVVYANVCVTRTPIENLSERCHEAAGDKLPDKELYNKWVETILNYQQVLCGGSGVKEGSPCDYLNKRMQFIVEKFKKPAGEQKTAELNGRKGTCHKISNEEECYIELPQPHISVANASFDKHVELSTPQCIYDEGDNLNSFVVNDDQGVRRTFYLDPKTGKLCADVKVPNSKLINLQNQTKKILNADLSKQCKDKASCARNLLDGIIKPRLVKLKATGASRKAGLCRALVCPEDKALKVCEKAMGSWNSSIKGKDCPGKRLEMINEKVKMLANFVKGKDEKELNKNPSDLQNDYKLCSDVFSRSMLIPKNYCQDRFGNDYAAMTKALLEEYKKYSLPSEHSLSSLFYVLMWQSIDKDIDKYCRDAISDCRKAVYYLGNSIIQDYKEHKICGSELNARRRLASTAKGEAYKPMEIRSKSGVIVGRISVKGDNTLIIKSTRKSQSQLSVQFTKENRVITSNESEGTDVSGVFQLANNKCEQKDRPSLCRIEKGNKFVLNGYNISYPSIKKCGIGQVLAETYNPAGVPASGRRQQEEVY